MNDMSKREALRAMQNHIFWTLCSGDPIHYHYFMLWLQHMICRPWEAPWFSMVLMGEKGIGKSLMAHILSAQGPGSVTFTGKVKIREVAQAVETSRLVVLDAPILSRKQAEKLALLMLKPVPKGRPVCRLLITTNLDWSWLIHFDRRAQVFCPATSPLSPETVLDLGDALQAFGPEELYNILFDGLYEDPRSLEFDSSAIAEMMNEAYRFRVLSDSRIL